MNNRTRYLAGACIAAAFAAVVCLAIRNAPAPGNRVYNDAVKHRALADDQNGHIKSCVEALASGTRFEGKWQINETPKPDWLNVIILSGDACRDAPPAVHQFSGGCAYVGEPSTIVIDDSVADAMLQKLPPRPEDDEASRGARRAVWLWVLGHEMGHVLRGHQPAHSGVGAHSRPESEGSVGVDLERLVSTSSLGHAIELEADEEAATLVAKNVADAQSLISLLIDVVNSTIRKQIPDLPAGAGIIYDYNNRAYVEYLQRGSHPDYVIRSLRILSILAPLTGDDGLAASVDRVTQLMRRATPSPPSDLVITGRLTRSDLTPIPHKTVELIDGDLGLPDINDPADRKAASTDPSGRFQFLPRPPGKTYYLLSASDSELAIHYVSPTAAAADVSDITLRSTPHGVLSGTVTDGDGKPVPNARLVLYATFLLRDDGMAPPTHSSRRLLDTTTDSRGGYRFEKVWQLVHLALDVEADGFDNPTLTRVDNVPIFLNDQSGPLTLAPIKLTRRNR